MAACAKFAIVGLAMAVGQPLIPAPVLRTVIGSLTGKMLAEFRWQK